MICKEIIRIIEQTYPTVAACDWDNVGLLVGREAKEVKKILVAVDLTENIIEEALKRKADMVITHHPVMFSPVKCVTDTDVTGRRLISLIQNDIACYAMHTNYDVLQMAELAEKKMHLTETAVLEEVGCEGEGIGRVGLLPHKMTLPECCDFVKNVFKLSDVRLFGNPEQIVEKVAISPGSGKSMVGCALEKGAQVLIAGDFDHHTGVDAMEAGLALIDAGHYGTEYMFMDDVQMFLQQKLTNVEVECVDVQFPFVTI